MSFFKRIKQRFRIGTVKLNLEVPRSVSWESSDIQGKVILAARSDQQISSLTFKLTEEFTTGRGEDKETLEFELGTSSLDHPVELKAGETKTIGFSLPFTLRKSSPAPSLSEEGRALGALDKAAKFTTAEKSTYKVGVTAKIQGTMFRPEDSKSIQIV